MAVGICVMAEVLKLEKVVVEDVVEEIAKDVPEATEPLVTELKADEALVGMTIVTTVVI